jgi:preprotein translocase subunit SecE
VSNEHDGVADDGQEPAGGAASGEAAKSSADAKAKSTEAAVVSTPAEPSDGREQTRKAPSSDEAADADSVESPSGETESETGPSLAVADAALTTPSPVSSGAARAAARRSAARAGVSESKGAATPRRADKTAVKRPNAFSRFGRFLREVVAELRKVIWPTRNQMVTYTIVVIVFVAFMVALVAGLDLLFAKGVLAVFG